MAVKRRSSGEDSVYFDQANGYWGGSVSLGFTPDGKRRLRIVGIGRALLSGFKTDPRSRPHSACVLDLEGQTGGHLRVSRLVRRDAAAIGKQDAGVFEHHDAVAEQAPALFGMRGRDVGRHAIQRVRGRTGAGAGT